MNLHGVTTGAKNCAHFGENLREQWIGEQKKRIQKNVGTKEVIRNVCILRYRRT